VWGVVGQQPQGRRTSGKAVRAWHGQVSDRAQDLGRALGRRVTVYGAQEGGRGHGQPPNLCTGQRAPAHWHQGSSGQDHFLWTAAGPVRHGQGTAWESSNPDGHYGYLLTGGPGMGFQDAMRPHLWLFYEPLALPLAEDTHEGLGQGPAVRSPTRGAHGLRP